MSDGVELYYEPSPPAWHAHPQEEPVTGPEKMEITYSGQAAEALSERPMRTIIPDLSWMPEIARAAMAAAIQVHHLQIQVTAICAGDVGLLALVRDEAARRGQLIESRALHAGWYVPDGRVEGMQSVLDDLTSGRLR